MHIPITIDASDGAREPLLTPQTKVSKPVSNESYTLSRTTASTASIPLLRLTTNPICARTPSCSSCSLPAEHGDCVVCSRICRLRTSRGRSARGVPTPRKSYVRPREYAPTSLGLCMAHRALLLPTLPLLRIAVAPLMGGNANGSSTTSRVPMFRRSAARLPVVSESSCRRRVRASSCKETKRRCRKQYVTLSG